MRCNKSLLLMAAVLLLFCRTSAANSVTIFGVGQVEEDKNIVVTESREKNEGIIYGFRGKDGAVWRGVTLMLIRNMQDKELSNINKAHMALGQFYEESIGKDKDFVVAEKAKRVKFGGRECAMLEAKLYLSSDGSIVMNVDTIIVPVGNGAKLVTFLCADNDAQYWRSTIQKIIGSIYN